MDETLYKIKKGDTLGAIAKKYNISVSELAIHNNIANPNTIRPDVTISIPSTNKQFSQKELKTVSKLGKPIYDTKKLYPGFDESKIDNEKVILEHHSKNKRESFIIIDKKKNLLKRFDENGRETASFRVGLGQAAGSDKYTINSKNKKVDRNTTPAGVYVVDSQNPNESYKHDYDNNILLLKNERGMRQATSIHQIPTSLKTKRESALSNSDLTDDDFSNGCINCTKEAYEKYLSVTSPGSKVYILPEEEGNYLVEKDGKLSFTTNKNKDFGQYNYTPKNTEYKPLSFESKDKDEYKQKFVHGLSNEKKKLMADLGVTSSEYDELAKRAYGIFGQETSFGRGSLSPLNNYMVENLYLTAVRDNADNIYSEGAFDKANRDNDIYGSGRVVPKTKEDYSVGLVQTRLKNIPLNIREKYGLTAETLNYPYQASVAAMYSLSEAAKVVRNDSTRSKYKNIKPDDVYDLATTYYNKPQTVINGNASGNNSYVKNVRNYYERDLVPTKHQTGGPMTLTQESTAIGQKKSINKTKAAGKALGLYDGTQTMLQVGNERINFFNSQEMPKTNKYNLGGEVYIPTEEELKTRRFKNSNLYKLIDTARTSRRVTNAIGGAALNAIAPGLGTAAQGISNGIDSAAFGAMTPDYMENPLNQSMNRTQSKWLGALEGGLGSVSALAGGLNKQGMLNSSTSSNIDSVTKDMLPAQNVDYTKYNPWESPEATGTWYSNTGGDLPLNSNSFQVKGNPNVTDGNNYSAGNQQIALDHNEVVKDNFVYSDALYNPLTGKTFAEEASKFEKSIGKAEKKLSTNPSDLESKNTIKYSNLQSQALAKLQEVVATQLGHRNQDGSTRQEYATGGKIDPPKGVTYEEFQAWYNAQPNIKYKLDSKKWDKKAIETYKAVREPYLQASGKNLVGGFSVSGSIPDYANNVYEDKTITVDPKTGMILNTKSSSGKLSNFPVWMDTPDGKVDVSELVSTPQPRNFTADAERAIGYNRDAFRHSVIEDQSWNGPDVKYEPNPSKTNNLKQFLNKQDFGLGDYLQMAEVGSKFFGTLNPYEREGMRVDDGSVSRANYDPSQQLYQSARSYSNAYNNIGANSINTHRAVANSLLAAKLNADNSIVSQYDSLNRNALLDYENRSRERNRFNIGRVDYTNTINSQNEAARDMAVQNAWTSVGQFGESLNRRKQNQYSLKLLQTLYPDAKI